VDDVGGNSTTQSEVSSEVGNVSVNGRCKGCIEAPALVVTDAPTTAPTKQGRPVSDRVLSDEKLVSIFT